MVSEGLIGGLLYAWSDDVGECVSRDDLRAFLRSDETREALARALYDRRKAWPPFVKWEHLNDAGKEPYHADADAVVRVLAGEPDKGAQ